MKHNWRKQKIDLERKLLEEEQDAPRRANWKPLWVRDLRALKRQRDKLTPEQSETCRDIFRRYVKGKSKDEDALVVAKLWDQLNRKGIIDDES